MAKAIGYVYFRDYFDKDDEILIKHLEKEMDVVKLCPEKDIDYESIKRKAENCQVVLNNYVIGRVTSESIEFSKTLEELGKTVINSSHSYYYEEDKWMFYLKCLEHKLPTPRTYLIPKETKYDSKEIKELLKEKELVLKAVFSERGLCVEKVANYPEFKAKLRKIVRRNPSSPLIAQEFVPNANKSYRATLIGHELRQFIVKIGTNWKQKGDVKNETFRTVKADDEVKRLCERASKAFGMQICGLDLVKNGDSWHIIEANSCPYMCFIRKDSSRLMGEMAAYLAGLS